MRLDCALAPHRAVGSVATCRVDDEHQELEEPRHHNAGRVRARPASGFSVPGLGRGDVASLGGGQSLPWSCDSSDLDQSTGGAGRPHGVTDGVEGRPGGPRFAAVRPAAPDAPRSAHAKGSRGPHGGAVGGAVCQSRFPGFQVAPARGGLIGRVEGSTRGCRGGQGRLAWGLISTRFRRSSGEARTAASAAARR